MARRFFHATVCAAVVFSSVACSVTPSSPGLLGGRSAILGSPFAGRTEKIAHVVYVIQENRSFDDLFQGYPGADTVSSGKDSHGNTIELQPISLKTQFDTDHSARGMFEDCRGTGELPGTQCRMDGFNRERTYEAPPNAPYSYVPHSESKPYWDMAHEWVLADKMFQSQLDESFIAHQYIIAAQAERWRRFAERPRWAAAAGSPRYARHDHRVDRSFSSSSSSTTSAPDELDKRTTAGASIRASTGNAARATVARSGRASRRSSTYSLRSGLEERHLAELEVHYRRS